ncbi:unnamed protein product [Prorocentrum cordatum]|uniref:Uncharacterized protein n=1 Tax=Prorocentrum cordatum TaxID=2364126 RepID=A0ABN9W6F4_9DINO|nr:unnamed protein product [Polarella glacialis]
MDGAPAWMAKVTKSADDRVDKKSKVVAAARSKGGDILRQLVAILVKLSLANSAELRDVCGVVYITFLIKSDQPSMKAARDAGQSYHAEVQRRKQASEDLSTLGPPYVQVWSALIQAIGKDSTCSDEVRKSIETYWKDVLVPMPLERVGEHVRHCRVRKTRKVESEDERMRLTFAVDGEFKPLERTLVAYFSSASVAGERKLGPAPRGALEREASRLLEKLGEGRKEKKEEDA